MYIRSKKIILVTFFSLLLCCLTLIFFRDAIFAAGAKWTCAYLSRTCLNGNFAYEKVELGEGYLVFSNIRVDDLHSQQERLIAKQLKLKYALGFNHLDLEVHVDEPQITLFKNSKPFSQAMLEELPRPYVKLRGQLIISNGTLVLIDEPIPQKVFFELEGKYRKRVPVYLAMKMGFSSSAETQLEINGGSSLKDEMRQFSLRLHQASCVDLANLGKYLFPSRLAYEVYNGIADGHLTLSLMKGQNPYLQGDVGVEKLAFILPQLQVDGEFPSIQLLFTKNESAPSKNLVGFFLKLLANLKGSIDFQEKPLVYYKNAHNPLVVTCKQGLIEFFPNFETQIKFAGQCCHQAGISPFTLQGMAEGLSQHAHLKSHLGGLTGEAEINWRSPSDVSEVCFSGNVGDCLFLLPTTLQKKLRAHFSEEPFTVSFSHQPLEEIQGTLKIGQNTIGFGCFLPSTQQQSRRSNFVANYKALETFFPSKTFHSPRTFNVAGMNFKDCWFEAKALNLSEIISPLLLSGFSAAIIGVGDFYGYFDDNIVELAYNPYEVKLENADFAIQIKDEARKDHHPALHYFELAEGLHCGVLPIQQGSYLQKNVGAFFEDIHTHVLFENSLIKMRDVETFSEGIFFGGEIDAAFDPLQKGLWSLDIHSNLINGKVSQLQQFLGRFISPSCFLKVPLEGEVSYRQEGGCVNFAFKPDTYVVAAKICGSITEGKMSGKSDHLRMQDFSLNFECDTQKKSLSLSDIEGLLIVGPPTQIEEYDFIGDYITFTDYTQNQGAFDLWISDKNRDMVRVVGSTLNQANGLMQVAFDQELTHFGDVHPQEINLVLEDWAQVDTLNFQCGFSLKSLLPDLQRIKGLDFFAPLGELIKAIQPIKKYAGNFQMSINYDKPNAQYHCMAVGKDLIFDAHRFETCTLNGRKKGNALIIDQLQLDQISLSADILYSDPNWDVNFLGFRIGETLLAGLEGIYNPIGSFRGKINLLEVDLEHLNKWSTLREVLNTQGFKGKLNADGNFHVQRLEDLGKWRLEAFLNMHAKNLSLNKIEFDDIERVSCHLTSDKGVTVKNVQLSIKNANSPAGIQLEKLDYDFIQHSLNVQDLAFFIPAKRLGWVGINLHRIFPGWISVRNQELIQKMKSEGHVKGKLDLDYSASSTNLYLELVDDAYVFFDTEMHLRNLSFASDLLEWKMRGQILDYQRPFWLHVHSSAPYFNKGEIIISELTPKQHVDKKEGIKLRWRETPKEGFQIDQIEGILPGLRVHLASISTANPQEIQLSGKVQADLNQIAFLLPDLLQHQVKSNGINGECSLAGNWSFNKELRKGKGQGLHFEGKLQGEKCVFRDSLVENLKSDVQYGPDKIVLSNLQVLDSSGKMEIQVLRIDKKKDDYKLSIPSIKVDQFRPSLLRNAQGFLEASATPFVIKQLEVQGLEGSLLHPSQITGEGKLTFTNPKKNMPNTILSTPGETISRIGLDTALLTPVSGSVYYKIQEGKIVFTRFKDLYSSGKLSKFNLPNTSYQSYIDFEGNLHVQLRMKQYNLLFKLAELFSLTIRGTLQHPTYTLQKQSHAGN